MKRRCFECIFGPKQGYTEQAWDNPNRMGKQEKRRVMELKAQGGVDAARSKPSIAPRPSQLQEERVEEEPETRAAATSDESRVEELPTEEQQPMEEGQSRVGKEKQESPENNA